MDSPVALIEAPAGYGKSVLASEYREELGAACAWVPVGPPDDDPSLLVSSLARSCRAANLSDLASVLGAADAGGWPDRFLDALSLLGDPLLVVLDDVHHLSGEDAGAVVLRLARSIGAPHRLLLTARRLPGVLESVRAVHGIAAVGAHDLAFNEEEASELASKVLGRDVSDDEVVPLVASTGGWPSALVLAARAMRGGDIPARSVAGSKTAELGASDGPEAAAASATASGVGDAWAEGPAPVIVALMDPRLQALSPVERQTACQLAHLPHFSPELATALSGADDAFARIVEAGVPVLRTAVGRWEMPAPVASYLAGQMPLTLAAATCAASVFGRGRQNLSALRMLTEAGFYEPAVSLLAGLRPAEAEEIGWAEIANVVNGAPESVLQRHPRALLHLARAAETAFQGDVRRSALERVAGCLDRVGRTRGELRRELDAETAIEIVRDERKRDEARKLASSVVSEARGSEDVARARAIGVLGRLRSWWSEDGPHEDARELLEEESRLSLRLGQPHWAARALASLAVGVYFALCQYDRALSTLDQTLALVPPRHPYRSFVLSFRVDVLCAMGRYEEAEAALLEMRRVATVFGEDWLHAYASWAEVQLARYLGDRSRTVRAAREVLQRRGTWFDESPGTEFLAQSAEALDYVGEHAMATDLLEEAKSRMPGFERCVCVFESAVLARSGDPARAEEVVSSTLARADLDPQERWPLKMMRAYVALRRDDPAAGLLAAEAFDMCTKLGVPDAPMTRDPAVAQALLPSAVAAGSQAAGTLAAGATKVTLTLLGGFEVRRGGRALTAPPGLPTAAICAVAVAGGAMHPEELIELLWPETAPSSGRNRLKNLMSRLRAAVGDVLVRDGDEVKLAPGYQSDAVTFESQARRALEAHASGARLEAAAFARSAVDVYRGELLPALRYENWVQIPRERLRALYLALLDLLADGAERAGEVDEATRLVQRGIDAEPYDEQRYVVLARLFISQGRLGSARGVLRRARAMLAELGVRPSPLLSALDVEAGGQPE